MCRKSQKIKKASVEDSTKYNPYYDLEVQISNKIDYKPQSNSDAQESIISANTNDQISNDNNSDDRF